MSPPPRCRIYRTPALSVPQQPAAAASLPFSIPDSQHGGIYCSLSPLSSPTFSKALEAIPSRFPPPPDLPLPAAARAIWPAERRPHLREEAPRPAEMLSLQQQGGGDPRPQQRRRRRRCSGRGLARVRPRAAELDESVASSPASFLLPPAPPVDARAQAQPEPKPKQLGGKGIFVFEICYYSFY